MRWALWAGALVPLVYWSACALAACFYPGFDFARQPVSELGSLVAIDQPHPRIFSNGMVGTSIAVILGSVGIVASLRRVGGNLAIGIALQVVMALVALSTAIVGLVPWL